MANLTSGSITTAFINDQSMDVSITPRKKYVNLKLTVASGSTWPKAGLKLPVAGAVGMRRNLDGYILQQGSIDSTLFTTGTTTASGSALMFSIDNTNNVLHAYQVQQATGSGTLSVKRMTSALGTTKKATLYVTAIGW